jgi:hypothetical protein
MNWLYAAWLGSVSRRRRDSTATQGKTTAATRPSPTCFSLVPSSLPSLSSPSRERSFLGLVLRYGSAARPHARRERANLCPDHEHQHRRGLEHGERAGQPKVGHGLLRHARGRPTSALVFCQYFEAWTAHRCFSRLLLNIVFLSFFYVNSHLLPVCVCLVQF